MLPSDTPPGTDIVVVWDSTDLKDYLPLIKPPMRPPFALLWHANRGWETTLPIGARFRLGAIEPDDYALCGYVVVLEGSGNAFHPKHFARATLPEELTRLLKTEPVRARTDA